MPRVEFDLTLFKRQLQDRIAKVQSPRQRKMLEVFSEHTEAEVAGELDRLMATMSPDPVFHVYHGGADIGPKGWDAVKAMYVDMFATCTNFMEIDYQRIIVDDDALFAEFKQRKILPGHNFAGGAYAEALRTIGQSADIAAAYLTQGRAIVIVPFDAQCRMMGEDAFSSGAMAIRKLEDEEIPDSFRARISA
jgi:hypothetical protein